MRKLFSLLFIPVLFACKSKDNNKVPDEKISTERPGGVRDSLLVTDSSWGPVQAKTDFDGLVKIFGNTNIKDERICGPECVDSVDVTFVFPGTRKEFVIYWNDSAYHKEIAFIRCYTPESVYYSADSVRIGTRLKELVQKNGKPISFSGFGWDYGGGIISLNKGKFENSKVRFNLMLAEADNLDNGLFGDTELNSDMAVVKKFEKYIVVGELFLSFSRD